MASKWAMKLGAKLLVMEQEDRSMREFNEALDAAAEEVARVACVESGITHPEVLRAAVKRVLDKLGRAK